MDKFAPFGSILAEALPCLSKDVIGVIARYLVAGKAAADTIPLLLCEFNGDSERGGQPWSSGRPLYIACRPDAIWVSDSVSVQIFDAECRFLGVAEHDIEQR